jgi:hypothetical protein
MDARGVTEQHERERGLGEQLDRFARQLRIDQPERVGADEQADSGEDHRPRDRRPVEPSRDSGEGEQSKRDRRQGPVHGQTLRVGHRL